MQSIWITWEDHRRSRELAAELNAKYIALTHPGSRYIRYPVLAFRTIYTLLLHKKKIVFCQNPSIVLNSLLCLLKPIFGYKLVVDRHSNFKFNTLTSKKITWQLFHRLSEFTLKHSDLIIVTNDPLKEIIESKGAKGFVLQDKIPSLTLAEKVALKGAINLVFVSTFSEDEPIVEIINAARELPDTQHLYITGNHKKYNDPHNILKKIPSNITLTGFMPEKDYQSLLASADIIIVITDQEFTLTCGAYEAISLEKAMVLSDTNAIKEYFIKGACYTKPNTESLVLAIKNAILNKDQLKQDTISLKEVLTNDWKIRFNELQKTLEQMIGT